MVWLHVQAPQSDICPCVGCGCNHSKTCNLDKIKLYIISPTLIGLFQHAHYVPTEAVPSAAAQAASPYALPPQPTVPLPTSTSNGPEFTFTCKFTFSKNFLSKLSSFFNDFFLIHGIGRTENRCLIEWQTFVAASR